MSAEAVLRPTTEEVLEWWDEQFEQTVPVGGDNHDMPVSYTPRAPEAIEENITYILNVANKDAS